MRIVTDSRPMDQPKEPAGDVLYDLYSLVAPDADRETMAALYRRGGFGYARLRRRSPTRLKSILPNREPDARNWRPTRNESTISSPTAPPKRAKRRSKSSNGPKMHVAIAGW